MSEPLLSVPACEVANKFGFYTDEAMQRPMGITRHGTTRVVMLSLKEYERLKRGDRQVIGDRWPCYGKVPGKLLEQVRDLYRVIGAATLRVTPRSE